VEYRSCVQSESGFEIEPVYTAGSLSDWDAATQLGEPGEYPYTRGVYPSMYTGRPWTIRQYAGFGTARESNQRYHQLVANGSTGLSVAFDLPTQMGYDSDDAIAHGEVGKVGVAIDSIDDMRLLFDGIPLDKVSTSMTINAPASLLLLLYQLVGEEQGVAANALTGTIQNDVLKEYIARGTYIFPPKPSLRLITDIFSYCRSTIPKSARRSQPVRTWTSSRRGWRSSSLRGRRCSRRSRSFARPAGSGLASCARSSARKTPARSCFASTRRPPGCSSRLSSPKST
jgi:methylmalonyl-CoA mutase cobalamin-binding domain/chain